VKDTYLCCRHCRQCLLQLGLLGCEIRILRELVRQSSYNRSTTVTIRPTFAVAVANACCSSAFVTAKTSSCASRCVSLAAMLVYSIVQHTFAVIACSSSASLAAKASSCANPCVSPVATGQTRYKQGTPLTSVLPRLAPVLHL
jgi:hypothetical protein